jgi:hypothetical protein
MTTIASGFLILFGGPIGIITGAAIIVAGTFTGKA